MDVFACRRVDANFGDRIPLPAHAYGSAAVHSPVSTLLPQTGEWIFRDVSRREEIS